LELLARPSVARRRPLWRGASSANSTTR
jgi:hypothetical protein